jgi:uncharacterized protein (TIGR04255 family)
MTDDHTGYWPVPLPDYARPPVVETVMAVHFARLHRLTSVEMLDFWRAHLRDEFPVASERSAYQAQIETFESPSGQVNVQMEFGPTPQRLRYWFLNESNEHLVQLQNDWLAFNWRKTSPDTGYRHYEYGDRRLRELYTTLGEYCASDGLGVVRPLQVEISYVNHIPANEGGWSNHSDLGLILNSIAKPRAEGRLPKAELASYTSQYVVVGDDEAPLGRLHVEAQPRFVDAEPAFMLRLTYRGAPEAPDLDGVFAALERGHHWIVGGFDELTTGTMHELWGRKDRDV